VALQQIHPTIAKSAMHARLVAFLLICSLFTVSTLKADDPPKKAQEGRAAAAQSADGNIMKVTEVEGITEYELENGVRVLLFPDPSKEVVTVNMTVFVGSRHEGYGEAGMAHLLEHMLFKKDKMWIVNDYVLIFLIFKK